MPGKKIFSLEFPLGLLIADNGYPDRTGKSASLRNARYWNSMTVNLMRYIDYWLGKPLCFLLSCVNASLKIFGLKKTGRKGTPKKILFIKLSELGALVLAYPLLKRAQEECPGVKLFFVTFEKNRDIFALFGNIIEADNILTIREDSVGVFVSDTFRVVRKMAKERVDIIFDLELFSRFTAILTFLIRADKKTGFYNYTFEGLYRGNFLTHRIQYNPLLHISKSYLSLWQTVKQEKKNSPEMSKKIKDKDITLPKAQVASEVAKQIEGKLKEFGIVKENKLFLLNPGEGTLPLREWPLENFITLSKRLLEDPNNRIILVGTKSGHKKAELLCAGIRKRRCLNLVGQTSLPELLSLFNLADALICNDCGLAHLASLASIKKFVIFGPETPKVFGPLGKDKWIICSELPCSPCLSALNNRDSACKDNICLKIIEPGDIHKLIQKNV
ncbi:MAG: glycosyltransferase family 9 protein [Nitrospirae bacterium]|nr:glycosyltransferase family 9 protein [Nitrospirota bacterium]